MPKIDAASVREHRARRLDLLVEAAQAILAEEGIEGLTAGVVAARAGIARNSIYRYFGSIDELVELVVTREFPAWVAAVNEAVQAESTPAAQVVAYVRANLEQAAGGSHGWRTSLAREALSSSALQRVRDLHGSLTAILDRLVTGLAAAPPTGLITTGPVTTGPVTTGPGRGTAGPELVVAVLQSLVDTCIRRIDAGDDPAQVISFACAAAERVLTTATITTTTTAAATGADGGGGGEPDR